MGTRLYVGNLPYETSEEDLNALFSQVGSVATVKVVADRFTGKSRGFGFVEMSSQDEARLAIEKLNGFALRQRPLRVNEAHADNRDEEHEGERGERPPRRPDRPTAHANARR
ncbi:MAG: RNA-binding protein [Nitrospirae bacterium]|nr:RNA-binding protein [Nitrospirota bacterium]